MRKISILGLFFTLSLSLPPLFAAKPAELDLEPEEKRAQEENTFLEEKARLAEESETEAVSKPGVAGFFERMNRGVSGFFDRTLKGTYKVATLGQSELQSYEVEEPEKGSEEPTKIKFTLPGT